MELRRKAFTEQRKLQEGNEKKVKKENGLVDRVDFETVHRYGTRKILVTPPIGCKSSFFRIVQRNRGMTSTLVG